MQKLLSSLQSTLAIDSSHPEGAVECLRHVLSLAQDMGFRVHNMDDMVGWAEYGEGEELVIVLGHLDVVAPGSGWTKPPFGGIMENGRLYGRGTTDDKGPILCALHALSDIKEQGIALSRRVRILFGTREETGCEDVKYYVNHGGELPTWGFTPDGEYPLIHGEKGLLIEEYSVPFTPGTLVSIHGGQAANMVPDYACAELSDGTKVEAFGTAAHGAEPWEGINAIGLLLQKLADLPGTLGTALTFLRERIGMESRGESLGIAMEDEISGPLSFNLGMLHTDGDALRVTVNYRYPVTKCYEDCAPQVKRAFESAGFVRTAEAFDEKLYIPQDEPLIQRLLGIYNAHTGENAKPICIGGGTYAKSMPNIVAFGPIFPGDEVTEHKPDEYITLENLSRNRAIYRDAIVSLASD